jgi:hypothetical protein
MQLATKVLEELYPSKGWSRDLDKPHGSQELANISEACLDALAELCAIEEHEEGYGI